MAEGSVWITPSPREHTLPLREFTWANPLTLRREAGVVKEIMATENTMAVVEEAVTGATEDHLPPTTADEGVAMIDPDLDLIPPVCKKKQGLVSLNSEK